MKYNYKIIVYSVVLAVFIATVYTGIFIFSAHSKVPDKRIEAFVSSNSEIESILNKAQNIFSGQKLVDGGIYHEVGAMEWLTKDDWNITSANEPYAQSYYLCQGPNDRFKEVAPVMYSELNTMFGSFGFSKNAQNTIAEYKESDNVMGYSYNRGYEKGAIQCLVRGYPGCSGLPGGHGEKYGSSIDVICTDQLARNELQQVPILKGINLKNNAIHSIHDYGEFIDLHVDYSEIIAKKEKDGKYTVLYKGQDAPPCEIEGKYDFPPELRSRLTTSSGAACPSK